MGVTSGGTGTPGYRPGNHGFEYDPDALADVRARLEREIDSAASSQPGSLPSLREAIAGLGLGQKFGAWQTALDLRAAHQSATNGVLAIYGAVASNLSAALERLDEVDENYLRADKAVYASIIRTLDGAPPEEAILPKSRLWIPPPGGPEYGDLAITRHRINEDARFYNQFLIRGWLQELYASNAIKAHYSMISVYVATADRLVELGRSVQTATDQLATAWWSSATDLVPSKKIALISASAITLGATARSFSYISEMIADALNEAFRGDPATLSEKSLQQTLIRLNHRYIECIGQYPPGLRFDLPFGGPRPAPPPARSVTYHRVIEPTSGIWPPYETNGMIGGANPRTHRPGEEDDGPWHGPFLGA